jgi:7-cyano-7-deazaguanine synthase in queuosine biosynthesis
MIDPDSARSFTGTVSTRGSNSRRTIRSLVLISGGIDSTYSLVRLLKETQDLVYVHHVNFIGPECGPEFANIDSLALSVREPFGWLRTHLRDFEYSQSLVDLSMFATRARENTSLMYFAAQAAIHYGFSPFDRILLGVNADADPGWHPDSAVYAWRRTLLVRMLRSVWECDEVPHLYFWYPRPSKHAMLDYLPTELAGLTFSCSRPTKDQSGSDSLIPCGSCSRCQWRSRVNRFQEGSPHGGDASATHTPPPCPHPGVGPSKMPIPCH